MLVSCLFQPFLLCDNECVPGLLQVPEHPQQSSSLLVSCLFQPFLLCDNEGMPDYRCRSTLNRAPMGLCKVDSRGQFSGQRQLPRASTWLQWQGPGKADVLQVCVCACVAFSVGMHIQERSRLCICMCVAVFVICVRVCREVHL